MNADLVIGKTPSGSGWKAYAHGQPNIHVTDWRGANYRIATVPGQPSRGFKTAEEALSFASTRFASEADFNRWSFRADGSFCTDERFQSLEMRDTKWVDGILTMGKR